MKNLLLTSRKLDNGTVPDQYLIELTDRDNWYAFSQLVTAGNCHSWMAVATIAQSLEYRLQQELDRTLPWEEPWNSLREIFT